jgi:hypothetical protein
MELGVFIPIGNNGWLISTTSPQYKPSFDLNLRVVEKAERFGFDFALSMIKLHGFGGPSQFWDFNLESFTLMAGLAAVASRIQLFATCAVLTLPPPIAARRQSRSTRFRTAASASISSQAGSGENIPRWESGQVPSTTAAATNIVPNTSRLCVSFGNPAGRISRAISFKWTTAAVSPCRSPGYR